MKIRGFPSGLSTAQSMRYPRHLNWGINAQSASIKSMKAMPHMVSIGLSVSSHIRAAVMTRSAKYESSCMSDTVSLALASRSVAAREAPVRFAIGVVRQSLMTAIGNIPVAIRPAAVRRLKIDAANVQRRQRRAGGLGNRSWRLDSGHLPGLGLGHDRNSRLSRSVGGGVAVEHIARVPGDSHPSYLPDHGVAAMSGSAFLVELLGNFTRRAAGRRKRSQRVALIVRPRNVRARHLTPALAGK